MRNTESQGTHLDLHNGIIDLLVYIINTADNFVASQLQPAGNFDSLQGVGPNLVDLGNALVAWTMLLARQKAACDSLSRQYALVAEDDAIAH